MELQVARRQSLKQHANYWRRSIPRTSREREFVLNVHNPLHRKINETN